MEYDLALKLKNAGFPQKPLEEGDFTLCQHCNGEPHEYNDTCNVIIIPTLSELIEACGDNMDILLKGNFLRWDNEKKEYYELKGYFAGKSQSKTYDDNIYDEFEPHGFGQTREEAIANLWLALQTKI